MPVLTFCNLKGGAGKTTSCLSIGAHLARRGLDVLLIDMDPQASLTLGAGLSPGPGGSVALLDGRSDPAASVQASQYEHLDVVVSDRSLVRDESMSPASIARALERLLAGARAAYAFVLVDPPPSASALVSGALLASDGVIAPVQTGRGALEGLGDTVQLIKRLGAAPIKGVFACSVDTRTTHDQQLVAYIKEKMGAAAFAAYVRPTVKVKEAEMAGVPLPFYDPQSTAAQDYDRITSELLARYGQDA